MSNKPKFNTCKFNSSFKVRVRGLFRDADGKHWYCLCVHKYDGFEPVECAQTHTFAFSIMVGTFR